MHDLTHALRSRRTTVTMAVDEALARIEASQPDLRAAAAVLHERARADACDLDAELVAGRDRGPLHGIPVGVKDVIDVEGLPTAAGSRLPARTATRSATVVDRLREAGAVIVAKTNTHEFAFGALTPPTRNPWDTDRMPGGSSGGSAALVGAGVLPLALGTDTGGSIREPAALCGATGFKPTLGRLPVDGVVPLSWSLDTIGPIAADVASCDVAFDAMRDGNDTAGLRVARPPSRMVPGSRLAVWAETHRRLDTHTRAGWERGLALLEEAGARIEEVSLGEPDDAVAATLVLLGAEALSYHRRTFTTRRDAYGQDVAAYLDLAASFGAADLVDAQRLRAQLRRRIDRLLTVYDATLTPAQLVIPPAVDDDEVTFDDGRRGPRDLTLIRSLAPFNLTGHPAISLPATGGGPAAFPVSLQLASARGTDVELLNFARQVEHAVGGPFPPPSTY